MLVTRDPGYAVEAAALFQAFNRCADGHDAQHVLDATINFLICGIAYHAATNNRICRIPDKSS